MVKVSPSGHILIYGISFLSTSLSGVSFVISNSLEITLINLWARNLKDFTYLSLPYILMTVLTLWPRGDRTKREQKHEGLTCSTEIKAPTIREEVSPSRRLYRSAVLAAAAVEASRFLSHSLIPSHRLLLGLPQSSLMPLPLFLLSPGWSYWRKTY